MGLAKFSTWCCANRLSVNISKTNFLLFTNRFYDNLPVVTFDNSSIERSSSVRFLGVELDDKLKFEKHLKNVSQKVSKNTGIISKLSYFIPKYVLVNLYHSLIESYLNYCPIIFGGAYNSHLRPLEVAQRKCIRIICFADRQSNADYLFADLKLLKFEDIYKLNLGIYMYKNTQFRSSFINDNIYNTRYSSLTPNFQRLSLTQRQSVAYQGPVVWNEIPIDVRNRRSLKAFKKHYKRFFISCYI